MFVFTETLGIPDRCYVVNGPAAQLIVHRLPAETTTENQEVHILFAAEHGILL